ncbi:MAG: hemerythrin domain-containing protein [Bacteroidales bacterium]|nr:hemerythrin domain-containing protein [Bacteroidales bacterium]
MFVQPSDSLIRIIDKNPFLILAIEHLKKMDYPKNLSIEDFCKQCSLPVHVFLSLVNIYNRNEVKLNFNEWNNEHIIILIDFLAHSHNYYKKEKYPLINDLLHELDIKIKTKEVKLLKKFFDNYIAEVIEHLDYEENTVFPYVKGLLFHTAPIDTNFSSAVYQEHHNDIEEKLSDLKTLLLHHVKFGNESYLARQIIFHLYELEYDLQAHSTIEEKLFIPLIQQLEKNNT